MVTTDNTNRPNKFQEGQQLYIRVKPDMLPFQVRVKGFSEKHQEYCLQRIGYRNTLWITPDDLDMYITWVDNPPVKDTLE